MQNRLLLNWNVSTLDRWDVRIGNQELGIGNFYFLFSVSYFLFPVSLFFFMHVYKVVSQKVCKLKSCKLTRWNWGFLFSVFYFLNCILQVRPQFHYIWLFHSLTISLLADLMFWHFGIWISFGLWILKFGFFRSYLNVCSFC